MTARPILVTGGGGQLASALLDAGGASLIRRVGRPEFDFDRPETIDATFQDATPALVVNAAAYTAVDAAETDAEAADRANHLGPKRLAALCAGASVPLIHVSTDYVFDGGKGAPYVETDPTAPQGVYGATKLAGEQAVLASGARAMVVRTSWVYAATGRNFVRTMLALSKTREELTVVADQKGCPTAAADLAEAILALARRIISEGWHSKFAGIFNAAGSGWTTWHGLAVAALQEAAARDPARRMPEVVPIATADWPTPAKRPADSRLDCGKLAAVWDIRLPDWRDALRRTVAAMDLSA
ncbi:MAG: dTDP-4-dehydrorhamnose reductase [Proteobacteria bacterium]|nr:dTDP-4-dehydrorhamnose reductase [Pseudomonadota bacterium]